MRIGNAHDLGNYVRDQRHAAGLNQADLAARAAVSRRWLAGLEAGKSSAEVGLFLRVVAALGQYVDVRPNPSTGIDLDAYLERFGGDDS
jgi:transcriptional regulator with XRE-family HTH domain